MANDRERAIKLFEDLAQRGKDVSSPSSPNRLAIETARNFIRITTEQMQLYAHLIHYFTIHETNLMRFSVQELSKREKLEGLINELKIRLESKNIEEHLRQAEEGQAELDEAIDEEKEIEEDQRLLSLDEEDQKYVGDLKKRYGDLLEKLGQKKNDMEVKKIVGKLMAELMKSRKDTDTGKKIYDIVLDDLKNTHIKKMGHS